MFIIDFKTFVIIPFIIYFFTNSMSTSFYTLIFTLYFMYSPKIVIKNPDPNTFHSPTSGIIRSIDINQDYTTISLFLNIFDNHTQYIPIMSSLIDVKQINGLFLPAYEQHAINNTRVENTLYNSTFGFSYKITQITGFLTRRIFTLQKINTLLNTGDRLGFILLGSRVDITIPSIKIKNIVVKKNQHIKALEPLVILKNN